MNAARTIRWEHSPRAGPGSSRAIGVSGCGVLWALPRRRDSAHGAQIATLQILRESTNERFVVTATIREKEPHNGADPLPPATTGA